MYLPLDQRKITKDYPLNQKVGIFQNAYVIVFCAIIALGIGSSRAQLIFTVEPTTPLEVEIGEETCFELTYAWSSTTQNATGTEMVVSLPSIFGGSEPGDFDALMPNPHIDSVTFDPIARELRFDFIDPLPAGSSGVLNFCVVQPNGTTEDGTSSTIGIDFISNGQSTNSQSATINADAESKVELTKSTIGNIEPAQGERTPYSIVVNNVQGAGNYDLLGAVVTDVLPPGTTYLNSSPTPVSIAVDDNGSPGDLTDDVTTLVWELGDIPAGDFARIGLTVQYDDPLGTIVENTASLAGTDPFSTAVSRSVTDTRTVSVPTPSVAITKEASTTKVSLSTDSDDITETIFYSFDIKNDGNVSFQDYVVEDFFPAGFYPTRLWTGFDSPSLKQNNVKIEYQLDSAPGTWVEHVDSPFVSPLETNPVLESPENNEVDLTVLGGNVIAVRWTYDTLPVAYHNEGNTQIFGEYRAPAVVNSTITNEARSTDPADPTMVTIPSEIDVLIVDASPRPQAIKEVIGATSGGPTDVATYRISVSNLLGGSTELSSPIATDVLPPFLTFVPGSVVANPPLTNFTESIDGTTGRPLLTFDWTGQDVELPTIVPNPGPDKVGTITVETFTVEFQVQVDDGTLAQDLINEANLTYSNPVINDSSETPFETQGAVLTILDNAILNSAKWVVGDLDIPSATPADLDFADAATGDDRAFETRFPDVGRIMPGGQFRYRVSLFNPGNEILENIVVMDILPHVGDIGVVATGENRETAWAASLIQHSSQSSVFPDATKFDTAGNPSPQSISVQWSTSSNPDRSELSSLLDDPTGGDAGTFNSGALPGDLSTVKSLLISFPGLVLSPLEGAEFYFYLQAPIDAPYEEIAWNSIGRSANVVGLTTPIPPAEPLKVGIAPNAVSLGDYVFIDSTLGMPAATDSNGIQDAGENPLPGATVSVFQYVDGVLVPATTAAGLGSGAGSLVASVVTDGAGNYFFDDLVPSGTEYNGSTYGDFVVQVTPPSTRYSPSPVSEADPNTDENTDNNGSLLTPPGWCKSLSVKASYEAKSRHKAADGA